MTALAGPSRGFFSHLVTGLRSSTPPASSSPLLPPLSSTRRPTTFHPLALRPPRLSTLRPLWFETAHRAFGTTPPLARRPPPPFRVASRRAELEARAAAIRPPPHLSSSALLSRPAAASGLHLSSTPSPPPSSHLPGAEASATDSDSIVERLAAARYRWTGEGPRPLWAQAREKIDDWLFKFGSVVMEGGAEMWPVLWIILINIWVTAAWFVAGWHDVTYNTLEGPDSWITTMQRHFTLSATNILEGRYWTYITSCFSHAVPWHLVFNMVVLHAIASPVITLIGPASFISCYILGSAFASLGWTHYQKDVMGVWSQRPTLGAAGGIFAVASCFAAAYPRSTIVLFRAFPLPSWLLISLYFVSDLYLDSNSRGERGPEAAGNITSVLVGVGYFLFLRRRFGWSW